MDNLLCTISADLPSVCQCLHRTTKTGFTKDQGTIVWAILLSTWTIYLALYPQTCSHCQCLHRTTKTGFTKDQGTVVWAILLSTWTIYLALCPQKQPRDGAVAWGDLSTWTICRLELSPKEQPSDSRGLFLRT